MLIFWGRIAFSKKEGQKCSTLNSSFLHEFSSKNYEILHKVVFTHQEYEDYFFGKKLRKKWGKKPVGGVSSSQDWSQKKPLVRIIVFFKRNIF